MRPIAGYALWIGHAGDLQDPRALFAAGIEAIIELADNEPFTELPREFVRCRVPLSDGGENSEWRLWLAIDSVVDLLKARVPTLVCCSCGLNRSVCVVAAAITRVDRQSLDDALLTIATGGPADVSPGLLAQIRNVLEGP
jgi:hypothetical protein